MPATFTAGPWRVGPVDDTMVTAADGTEIAAIDGDYSQPETWPVMEANARLIAAAPDMHAALVAAKQELWMLSRHQWTMDDFKNLAVVQQIDAALTKADGKQRDRAALAKAAL